MKYETPAIWAYAGHAPYTGSVITKNLITCIDRVLKHEKIYLYFKMKYIHCFILNKLILILSLQKHTKKLKDPFYMKNFKQNLNINQ